MDTPTAIANFINEYSVELSIFLGIFVFVLVALTVAALAFFMTLDCDLMTYLYSKYGIKPEKALKGKVIWISGACSGIGEQLAYDLASIGSKLVLSGHLDTLNDIKYKCLKLSQGKLDSKDILALPPFDIREYQLHKEIVQTVINYFDRVDILINNIGRSQRATFQEITISEDKEIFDINVFGQINLSRCVMNQFVKQGFGHFVVTSSVAGKFGAPFSASYTASKHAIAGYFESIRCEGFSKGVRVTTICPGPVLTPLIERSFHSESFLDEVRDSQNLTDGKLHVTRCTKLMLAAISNKLQESWISLRPILWFCYCYQYFPDISKYIMVRYLPPDKLYKMRKGNKSQNDGPITEEVLRRRSRALSIINNNINNNFLSMKASVSCGDLADLISPDSKAE